MIMASPTTLSSSCNVGGAAANRNPVFLRPSSLWSSPPLLLVKQSRRRSPKLRFTVRASETHADGPIKKLGLSDAECEAAVVAGNVPEAPPIPPKPAAPSGTPVMPSLPLSRRPRRNRKSPALRAAFQETTLSPTNFVYPLFIHEGEEDIPIGAMPGCYRLGWRHGLLQEWMYT